MPEKCQKMPEKKTTSCKHLKASNNYNLGFVNMYYYTLEMLHLVLTMIILTICDLNLKGTQKS